jgi:hypothetical protein
MLLHARSTHNEKFINVLIFKGRIPVFISSEWLVVHPGCTASGPISRFVDQNLLTHPLWGSSVNRLGFSHLAPRLEAFFRLSII